MDKEVKLCTGDIATITRAEDGKQYDAFIIEVYDNYGLFYGRVLESSKDKVATSSWSRYGLEKDGVCQLIDECSEIKVISKGKAIKLEDVEDTCLYQNKIPGTNKTVTFCLSEDFGGWSESSDEEDAILESCSSASLSKVVGGKDNA